MKKLNKIQILFLLFILFSVNGLPQVIDNFKNYSSFNFIENCIYDNGNIIAASNGGFFIFSEADSTYKTYTKSENLSSHQITSIAIDKHNRIWLGTEEGVIDIFSAWDLSVQHIFDIKNSNYNSKRINDILIKGDTAFVSTDFGISLININNNTFLDTYTKLGVNFSVGSSVKNIFIDKKIYASNYEGLAVQKTGATNLTDPSSWQTFPLGSSIPTQKLNDVILFNDTVLVATEKGIYKLSVNLWEKFNTLSSEVLDMFTKANILYYVTSNTAYKYENNTEQLIFNALPNMKLNKIFVTDNNSLLISTNAGLVSIAGTSTEILSPNAPKTNNAQSLTIDKENNLWICSQSDELGYGIFKFNGNSWTSFAPFPLSGGYHKTYSADDNTIYFCNWGNGFTRYRNGRFHNFTVSNTPLQGIPAAPNFLVISDIKKDNNNNTWILNHQSASNHVLSVLTNDSIWYNFNLGNPICYNLAIDNNGNKWFAELNTSLHYFNEMGTFENTTDDVHDYLTTSHGLNSNLVNALVVDKRGALWVGTSLGVNIVNNTASPKNSITYSYPLKNISINCISVDALNLKWVGSPQGIFLVSQDGNSILAQYNSSNSPLPSNNIRSITFNENSGVVYIGTDKGITTITTASIKPEENFSELFIFPNPVVVNDNNMININITGLVEDSQIKILSIDGKLINEFPSPGGNIAVWNGLDNQGKLVSTGIYLIVAYDKTVDKITTSKVAIIRK
ncbi:MAG: hypothetical protein JW866_02525 [Ignavibacteriales bacterium]|nr:hypothetical protein [Ignavibacteriales bacterium]